MSQFRTINRIVGSQPKVGPFAAYQILPFSAVFVLGFILMQMFGLHWLQMIFFDAAIVLTFVIVLGKHSWQLICRLYKCPYIVRGGAIYLPLLPFLHFNFNGNVNVQTPK